MPLRRMVNRFLFTLILCSAVPALAKAPKVAELSPANGAADVDPDTKELRIVFDCDMSTMGWSFCGGGPTYPPIQGDPKWINKRTIVAKVRLQPDHDYRLSLNCPPAENFRSADGTPLKPVQWSFSTASVEAKPDKAEQKKLNEQCLKQLMTLLKDHYSYYDLRVDDWQALEKKHRKKILGAATTRAWVKEAAAMLAEAKDVHMLLNFKGQQTPTHIRTYKSNINIDGVKSVLPGFKQRNPSVSTARTDDGIGYILITTLAVNGKKDLEQVQEVLDEYKDCKALILDLRANNGGSEPLAKPIAAWFVKGEKVYSKSVSRDPKSKTGFTEESSRTIQGNKPPRQFDKPVAVLIGPGAISSGESFVLMMKQGEKVTLIGSPTAGCSGNPKPYKMENDVEIFIPSWKDMLPDGTCLEGKGIEPDVKVKAKAADFEDDDPVIKQALRILRKKDN
ncbi:MAG TPA: S41 family peptidase [Phycisphaerae bacterium]|nr:S41 family peptidase [Phycisphaerae bacterium]